MSEGSDGGRRRALSHRPKTLDAAPSLFRAGGGDTLSSTEPGGPPGQPPSAPAQGSDQSAVVEHHSRSRDIDDLLEETPVDPAVAAMSRQIATNLALRRRPPRDRSDLSGGPLTSGRYRYRSDDIDLDRTLAVLAELPHPDDTDIVVRERTRAPRAAVLVIDVSGSMRGEKARMAAATVGALVAEFGDDPIAVVAFWSDAAVLTSLDEVATATQLLDVLVRIPTRGLTNVAFGLEVAAAELARSTARRRVAVLLTDALHNAGPDPRDVAATFPELHVLAQVDGAHDLPLATELARRGHGRMVPLRTHRDVAPALNRLLHD